MSEFDSPDIFRSVLESLQTGVYFVDANQRILFWNEGAEKITGYLRQEVVGAFCRDDLLAKGEGRRNVLVDAASSVVSVLREGKPTIAEVSLRHKLGHRIYVRMRAVPIRNAHGSIIGAAESFEESLIASEWDRRQSKLAAFGCIDPVAGVLNSAYTLAQLKEKVAILTDYPLPFSVMWAEVDRIEQFRANYGQAIIPHILRVAGQTIETSLRPSDFLGRVGDHRFLAILTECGNTEIGKIAERVIKMVSTSQVEWWGEWQSMTASLGGCTARAGDTVKSLLDRAERALVHSSVDGGNRFTFSAQ